MAFKDIFVYPRYHENLKKLYELSYNLWCTWNYDAINLFYKIDAPLFRAVNHNPVEFLLALPREKTEELAANKGFLLEIERVWKKFQDYIKYGGTIKKNNNKNDVFKENETIAYFAMEYGLHECIPIYSGGLGVLSGDFLKAASDMGWPVVGVGLVYKFGYFTQRINLNGYQEELFIEFQNHLIPIHELRGPNGDKAYIDMNILNQNLRIKLWQIDVGKSKLILLDTDIEDNPLYLRDITYELYVANREKRLQQEMVLGFGGVKALEMLNIEPKVYHLNEGHSAFLIIARLQQLMAKRNLSFFEAAAMVKASTIFTTHTPIIAGNENFEIKLAKKYLEPEIKPLGISMEEFSGYGFIDDKKETFWLPALAMKFSKHINCVSKLHRDVSRRMWSGLFSKKPMIEIPIDYVTNGVHTSSWISEAFTGLLDRYIGPDYIHRRGDEQLWNKIMDIPDSEIWEAHQNSKLNLLSFMRRKLVDDASVRGYSRSRIMGLTRLFNPEYLTIVFARRFAHYKRATLILKDKERLRRILTNPKRPVQLIFSGKAHPADTGGKNMIKEIIDFAKDYHLEDSVVFLENYDINIARHLVWGADVWLNTPIMENEASGTSGMKAAMNGVLNLSVMDGWWPEGYNGHNGWAITAGEFYKYSDLQETAEANQIYDLLEGEITELFYERNESGIPLQWVRMMKASLASICGNFNMNRVLTDYLNKFYTPAKKNLEKLCAEDYRCLKDAAQQERDVLRYWGAVRFADFTTSLDEKDRIVESDRIDIKCTVNLDNAPAELFSVELFYMFDNKNKFKIIPMTLKNRDGALAHYECSLQIEGHGLQSINVRIKPANETVQDMHPDLVKWLG